MRTAMLCIFLIQQAITTFAQSSDLDELPLPILRHKLATSKNDTNRVKLQLALGHLMFFKPTKEIKDIDSAAKFAEQASTLSYRLKYDFGIINSMLLSAESFYNRNDRQTGLKIAQNALAFAQMRKNSDGEARSYHQIAQYYPISDPVSLQQRIMYINKAIEIFRRNRNYLWLSYLLTGNSDLLFRADRVTEGLRSLFEALDLGKAVSRRTVEGIYLNISRISFKLGDYTNSLKYSLLALETAKEVSDTTIQLTGINHIIASTYIKMEDYSRAIPFSIDVLSMAKRYHDHRVVMMESPALALEYLRTNQADKAFAVLNDMKSHAVGDLDNLSVAMAFINNLVDAKHFSEAARYVENLKSLLPKIAAVNIQELMDAYNALASYYSATGDVKHAYRYTELYATMAHKQNFAAGVRTAEYRYYELLSLKGDKKSAMAHFLKEKKIKDSIDNIAKTYQISLLHIENEALEKNKHIDSLTREALLSDAKLKRNQLIQKVTVGGTVLLMIITALVYNQYRLKQRSNAQLLQQKLEIDHQNLSLKHLIADKNLLLGEKDLLLKEVNHRVKNNLQIVMSLLASQSVYLSVESAHQAILESQNRVRSIALIHDQLYKTDNVTEINLLIYIKELIQSLDNSLNHRINKIVIDYDVDDITLDVSQAIPVGIILNEMVTNAIKYAFPNDQPGSIAIRVKRAGKFLEVQVSDNGVGLPEGFNLSGAESLGITLLEGLTEQLEGSLSIENKNGLTVFLKFPVKTIDSQKQSLT
ncbi:sensor histidine kinase [Mucilaginibacter sp. SG538B]|uniref:sensor histidine kinase n=1 Tax=Mucilaginibacter sp. SG538B TaxID=2587021 RepID=UPI00159D5504|nr:sensor histidine kinase [Mucilaginibacter sp. SG538B]